MYKNKDEAKYPNKNHSSSCSEGAKRRWAKLTKGTKEEISILAARGVTDTEIVKITGANISRVKRITTEYWKNKMAKK